MKKWPIALAIIMLEIAAVFGATIESFHGFTLQGYTLWEYSNVAWWSFLGIAAVIMVFVTRRMSTTLRIISPIGMVGALVLTVEILTAFTVWIRW